MSLVVLSHKPLLGSGGLGGTDVSEVERSGIDRRTLIKRAAATGAVAWTAPMILDSLASPAAALTNGPCDLYVFRMQREGGSGNCNAVISPTSGGNSCATPTVSGSVCTGFTRQTNTTSPVLFTATGNCTGGANQSVTFTINQPGREFAGTFKSAANTSTCPATATLTPASGNSVTLAQTGLNTNGVWWAYLAVGQA
jgi:hypothetical protein